MAHPTLSDTARAAAVRTTIASADLRDRLVTGVERRAGALRADGERGSQTAEYAMVGGVGAAAAAVVIYCVKETSILEDLLSLAVSFVGRLLR